MSAKVTNFYIKKQDTKGTPRLVLWILSECAEELKNKPKNQTVKTDFDDDVPF